MRSILTGGISRQARPRIRFFGFQTRIFPMLLSEDVVEQ